MNESLSGQDLSISMLRSFFENMSVNPAVLEKCRNYAISI
jgi:hypothetical protein